MEMVASSYRYLLLSLDFKTLTISVVVARRRLLFKFLQMVLTMRVG